MADDLQNIPVKFVKFLRRPFFTEHLQWMPLIYETFEAVVVIFVVVAVEVTVVKDTLKGFDDFKSKQKAYEVLYFGTSR